MLREASQDGADMCVGVLDRGPVADDVAEEAPRSPLSAGYVEGRSDRPRCLLEQILLPVRSKASSSAFAAKAVAIVLGGLRVEEDPGLGIEGIAPAGLLEARQRRPRSASATSQDDPRPSPRAGTHQGVAGNDPGDRRGVQGGLNPQQRPQVERRSLNRLVISCRPRNER